VWEKGPATEAGLQAGDVITAVDGVEVADARSVLYRLQTRGVGNRVRLDILRKTRPVTLTISLRGAPEPTADDMRDLKGVHPFDGARVSNLSPQLSDELGLEDQDGVVMVAVRTGSTAQRLGFQPGDVIVQVGREPIATVLDLERSVAQRQRTWTVGVKRGGRLVQLQVQG
jgi:S1-C subfamily serine protease